MTLSGEKYVSATTYRRSGAAVPTATWIVPLDGGRFGVQVPITRFLNGLGHLGK